MPETIARLIARKTRKKSGPTVQVVVAKIDEIARRAQAETVETLVDELSQRDRAPKVKGALAEARRRVDRRWRSEGGAAVVSGKAVLGELKKWATNRWGFSFSPMTVARELRRDEPDGIISGPAAKPP